MVVVATKNEQLEAFLAERFVQLQDQAWYPIQRGVPLVRIIVGSEKYAIERRRNHHCSWMPVFTGSISGFDIRETEKWADYWSLVEANI